MSEKSKYESRLRATVGLVATFACCSVFGTLAQAETIGVSLETPADTYTVGDVVDVEVRATTSAILVGYGFDLAAGAELSYDSYAVGPGFVGVSSTPDGDGMAGLSFSATLDGVDILLGTARFDAISVGDVLIELSTTSGDLTEGFAQFGTGFFDVAAQPLALSILGPPDELPPAGGGGSPPGVPEPTTISLLAAGCLAMLRRRR